ncbi:MFS transporter [Pontibacter akesuensis]|uniref:Predicted arabinose efflux permease, MFS family n=1 Tax=Pontibacter akesuensis TaxID=388950 RepID=A0A1I7JLL0_9BACT|nr:MFS transporter [Pontibacter akesuensis]GHA69096.1 membrane protein [Pontibacter akesuensis]SFU86041.1 Predicted arabinose efflux permease, MFS family [Pontibacter akesuensis]
MPSSRILPTIVFSQFAGTSLWFAGNAVLPELQASLGLQEEALGLLTSAVQFGFILGTLCFAFFSLADRVSPRKLFLGCALFGALANVLVLYTATSITGVLLLRGATGFLLAGIYPAGMKIAASWYSGKLGKAIGYLVGALVLGTAFPYLLRGLGAALPWQTTLLAVSILAAVGGVLMYLLVPDGPYLSKGAKFEVGNMLRVFKAREFRAAAFGYFGHMWELYTFWAFVPVILAFAFPGWQPSRLALMTFSVIAAGAVGCIGGGYLSQRWGSGWVAFAQLLLSGVCCVLSVWVFQAPSLLLPFLVFWGVVVAGDSPQFSALTARMAPPELVGTALTVVTSIGFAITIISIQLTGFLATVLPLPWLFVPIAVGPLLGLLTVRPLTAK